ncbi:MAG TPA: sporulation/spore germination protein [Allocoleopsis sp.]
MMNFYKIFLTALIANSLLLGLSSCNTSQQASDRADPSASSLKATSSAIQPTNPVPTATPTPPVKASSSPASPTRSQSLNTPANTVATAQNTITVNIYKVDSQCETLVPEKATVSAQQPMEAAISKALAQWDTADFSLAGYRVSVDPQSRVATVDLRVNPNSKRQLESLSSCEQLALLGAINKTLTGNPQWRVESVRFTEQGEELVL